MDPDIVFDEAKNCCPHLALVITVVIVVTLLLIILFMIVSLLILRIIEGPSAKGKRKKKELSEWLKE